MKRAAKMFVLLLPLVFFSADAIQDSCCQDEPAAEAGACAVCAACSHIAAPNPPRLTGPFPPARFTAHEPSPYAILLPQLIFHPPCPAA